MHVQSAFPLCGISLYVIYKVQNIPATGVSSYRIPGNFCGVKLLRIEIFAV